jgi:ribonuclease Z
MELSLFFAGTAGSVPTARRGMPATLLRRGSDRVLFDCGEGTQRQLLRTVGLPDVGAVFLSHLHADHWLGLPGMLKSFDLRDRDAPLAVYGPPGTAELMRTMRVVYGRLGYPLSSTASRSTRSTSATAGAPSATRSSRTRARVAWTTSWRSSSASRSVPRWVG